MLEEIIFILIFYRFTFVGGNLLTLGWSFTVFLLFVHPTLLDLNFLSHRILEHRYLLAEFSDESQCFSPPKSQRGITYHGHDSQSRRQSREGLLDAVDGFYYFQRRYRVIDIRSLYCVPEPTNCTHTIPRTGKSSVERSHPTGIQQSLDNCISA
ncbi:hypothetical protein EDD18DRAFT_282610 [Armillaria luteobubalina]|uniref:Uncharacterized protein n=1 Tax=Armillaria luteobubalina TaxID=153913 RepID=A0AA39Q2T0_9AGAR|nr:hypothetical protein EDD18DRAFT_282610 [Armillaria luteobubalina]